MTAAWSEAEVESLRDMYAAGVPRGEMANRLGRTKNAIRHRLSAIGLTSTKWTPEEVEWLRSFYEAACGRAVDLEIAVMRLGRRKSSICRKANELGLTDQGRPKALQPSLPRRRLSPEERSDVARRRIRRHGHNRGFAGKSHSESTREAISQKAKAAWADPESGHNGPEASARRSRIYAERLRKGERLGRVGHSRCRGGKRADLGDQYFRSAWEANYARYLNWVIANGGEIEAWEYEPRTFEFPVKRGPAKFYTPDFLVTFRGGRQEWHEVKGWMDQPSKTRLKRMAKYYPDETVVVIGTKWFRGARKDGLPGLVPNWEKGTTR